GVLEKEEWELAASSLRKASDHLGGITGETVSADILEEIFSRFCIGK
ncbi:MAG: tRNA uridine-5-carboxymethylaminomethyl(34) synthesis GTPase MnmE, partial [Lentisphaeria bacterium]|nr:tRNA uridine-5-carboxymethylaminomethyl(34) synthesis GTPase MnmE [Lentisphaeria bacterium]